MLTDKTFSFPWLLWLGLKPYLFSTYDYFPLFPFFGLVLIGIFIGKIVYSERKVPEHGEKPVVKQVYFLGRHALMIYLIHVPVLLLILHLTA